MTFETLNEEAAHDADLEAAEIDNASPEVSELKSVADAVLAEFGIDKDAAADTLVGEAKSEDKDTPNDQAKPDDKAETKPEDKPKSDDEMPEGLSAKSQERFKELTGRLKEKDSELQQYTQAFDVVREAFGGGDDAIVRIQESAPYFQALAKQDWQTVESILIQQLQQVSLLTGKSHQVDALAAFPDLREKVDAFELDEGTALELARVRQAQQHYQTIEQTTQQAAQQQVQTQLAYQQGGNAVMQLATQWETNDPDYKAKEAILMTKAAQIRDSFPPHQWAQQLQFAYDLIGSMPAQNMQQQRSPGALRPTNLSGQRKAPTDTASYVLRDFGMAD